MKKPILTMVALLAIAPVLAGCGTTRSDRALSGGGIGAVGGAALMAVTGGPILAGAAVGAAAGAVTGAVTSPDEINLDGHHKRHHNHHKK